MKYSHIVHGIFLNRPNRFIAHVQINGREEICHVKNTGRCRELLVPGCTVYCNLSDNPKRKTKYDLIAVEKKLNNHVSLASADENFPEIKNSLLINMDSQAPNTAVKEWLSSSSSPFGNIDFLKPECKFGSSRFDFYLECKNRNNMTNQNTNSKVIHEDRTCKIFIEVKGVTLEENGVVMFPDAPTERGVKHIYELIRCHAEGFETYVIFVVQMAQADYFSPNRKTHPQFADALYEAKRSGVQLLAYTCAVTPDKMKIDKPLPIKL